ncbi:hypothetical protein A3A79_03390 [Candidatus Gottesmanbacteria bacterium RIFCSPLOWO2_01_FULL_43_11b]|uniref:Bacterial Ig-like domain-containing protein n=1 Tax=Candidatus Gottesmanbacteria bacterium RIFCSPLOWO2_01_FULL_43_11b TaxID=1798392 RepID=A0A1F6AHX9_9BACT|nr:MAG: hypothetical protein A3A79_03390 [Candidatus Gottesmanbacteria bacterium RIFCSPLOWO2_01_FULL_43_11b]
MKRVILIIVAILVLLAIPVTVFLVSQQQELRKRATPATTLSLLPATVETTTGESFSIDVRIDTGENQVVTAEIALSFDPEKLQAESITNGQLFPNILTSGSVDSGTASIAVGAPNTSQPITGIGTAAVVRFKALAATEAPVSVRFASTTFVGGLGEESANVLVGTTPARVTITGGSQETTVPLPTPTLSDEEESTQSGDASSSAVLIIAPEKNESVADELPTITGKAPPGSTVTLVIRSNPVTVTVTADANGNWSYTPTIPLVDGTHSVVASAIDPVSGQTQTSSTSFIVAAGGGNEASTDSATPVAGTVETTIFLLSLGFLLLLSGVLSRYGKLS